MNRGTRALLDAAIDYAGLFPPAELSMDGAVGRWLCHRRGPHGWMLARFVCPAARLDELATALSAAGAGDRPLPLVVLATSGDGLPERLDADLAAAHAAARHDSCLQPEVVEARVPDDDLAEAARAAAERISSAGLVGFLETSLLGAWESRVESLVGVLAAVRQVRAPGAPPVGLKIRCGGPAASAFPSVEAVAAAVVACREAGIALKATQGLHHPVSHRHPELGAHAFGFLNLIVAVAAAKVHCLDEPPLREILAETDPAAFELRDDGVAWRDLDVGLEGIAASRERGFAAFGSCSFSEPRDDLQALGHL